VVDIANVGTTAPRARIVSSKESVRALDNHLFVHVVVKSRTRFAGGSGCTTTASSRVVSSRHKNPNGLFGRAERGGRSPRPGKTKEPEGQRKPSGVRRSPKRDEIRSPSKFDEGAKATRSEVGRSRTKARSTRKPGEVGRSRTKLRSARKPGEVGRSRTKARSERKPEFDAALTFDSRASDPRPPRPDLRLTGLRSETSEARPPNHEPQPEGRPY